MVLEPSCAAVFRDELLNLFPQDERAHKLSRQTFLLSEFLEKKAADFQLPHLAAKALIHGHCHHKSLMKMTDEESVLRKMGIDWSAPAPGCCGMAGSFGFDEEKYDVSMAIGELELLPAVRQAAARQPDHRRRLQLPRTDRAMTDRHALHLAEVIATALKGPLQPDGTYPEKPQVDKQAGRTGSFNEAGRPGSSRSRRRRSAAVVAQGEEV